MNTTYEQEYKGCFWEIEHDGDKGYLLGTIHSASDHLIDPEGKIMECFKRCQSLAFETDFGYPLWNDEAVRAIQLEEVNNQLNQLDQADKARLVQNTIIVLNAIGCKVLTNDLAIDKAHIDKDILQLINFIYP